MKVEIIDINQIENIFKTVPNLFNYIYDYFGEKKVMLFSVCGGSFSGIIAQCEKKCLYIRNEEKIDFVKFTVDDDYNLVSIDRDNYVVSYENGIPILEHKETGVAEYLVLRKSCFIDDYDGLISYVQHNPVTGMKCELQYQQMYREDVEVGKNPPIYDCHMKVIYGCFFDENTNKYGVVDHGFVRHGAKYFIQFDLTDELMGQMVTRMKELNFKDSLEMNRYYNVFYVNGDGDYLTLFPFSSAYTEEDIKRFVVSKDFKVAVPDILLDIYNSNDLCIREVKMILEQLGLVVRNGVRDRIISMTVHP